jgi:hypothetical protein
MDQSFDDVVSTSDQASTTTGTSRTGPLTSSVNIHCRLPEAEEAPYDAQNRKIYYCKYCPFHGISTTNVRKHLLSKHQINCNSQKSKASLVSERDLAIMYEQVQDNVRKAFDSEILKKSIDTTVIRQCLIDLVTVRSLPLSVVEWSEFHTFCRALNPEAYQSVIPSSHNTMVSWIKDSFIIKKDLVRKTLQSAITRIHLSLDVWTSPNNYLVIAICGHFLNIDEKYQTILLALRRIKGHAGEVQFEEAVLPVLQEYEIVRKVGTIVGDNSGTNDTLCRTLSQHLRQTYPRDPEWIPIQQRIRCLGHILNLIVQAFLFPKEANLQTLESYEEGYLQEEEETEQSYKQQELAEEEQMRSILGPLGKLHNIVVYIRSSPQRLQDFISQAGRRIPLDNRTRWNSWYNMLHTIFRTESDGPNIQAVLASFCIQHSQDLALNLLDTKDWLHLQVVHDILECFATATLLSEGHNSTLDIVLENMDICIDVLEDAKVCLRTKVSTF